MEFDPSCEEAQAEQAYEMLVHGLAFFSPVFIVTVCFNRCYDPV